MINIGIDASNIKSGGGLTHLKELLSHFTPDRHRIRKIYIYSLYDMSDLPDEEWIVKRKFSFIGNNNFIFESFWKFFLLYKELKKDNIHVLFVPGGSYVGTFKPFVTMSQNMLVFEQIERARYGWSWTRARLKLLNFVQTYTFKSADGLIFISNYASNYIHQKIKELPKCTIIHHGISEKFEAAPRIQHPLSDYSAQNPFKLLYVSVINVYKHQENVIKAVKALVDENYPIELELIGSCYEPMKARINELVQENKSFVTYTSAVKYELIAEHYKKADGFIFASTCENMPNILIEAMSAGLPIVCSSYGPMPEFLLDAGIYVDPLDVNSMTEGIRELVSDHQKRGDMANKAHQYSKKYNWSKCSDETFNFIINAASK